VPRPATEPGAPSARPHAGLAARLQAGWTRRGPLARALWPLALLFGLVVALRRTLYRRGLLRQTRLARPVVVIGNLVVGGAGKTPLVLALVAALRARGRTPGVISRGYGGSASAAGAVLPAKLPDHGPATQTTQAALTYGDEACLVKRRSGVPMAVGADRVLAGQRLLAAHPEVDVILCDDGLQHYALARDVEIAVFDNRAFGNGWLLPAGPLREPLERLREVDALVINGAPHGAARLVALSGGAPLLRMEVRGNTAWRLTRPLERVPLASLAGRKLRALAGIGQPERFFDLLAGAGLRFTREALPDHHDFRGHVVGGPPDEVVLMTEKDAVKCAGLNDPRLWVVPVDAEVEPRLVDLILENIRGRPTA